ncbi:MAG TPA: translocation/assembly module TamB domain-containing protein [bacterium]
MLKVNERTKKLLIKKVQPILGENCQIEKLYMTLSAVHLKGVAFTLKDSSLSFQVQDIRLGLNFISLIKNRFRPQRIPHDILFVKPHLLIRDHHHANEFKTDTDSLSVSDATEKYLQKAKDLDFIKRITISKGSISYLDSTKREALLAHDVNGWLSLQEIENSSVRLVGKLFQSQNFNLIVTGDVDLLHTNLDLLNIQVNNFEWKERIPFLLPDYFDVRQGHINGTIIISQQKLQGPKFNISGEISVADGSVQITDNSLFFDDINISAHIGNGDCIFSNSSFLFNGSHILLAGKINNILNPGLELTMQSDRFDLKKAFKKFNKKARLNFAGNSSLLFSMTNTFANPTITGQIAAPKLTIDDKAMRNVRANIVFKDTIFQITNFAGEIEGMHVTGKSQIDFSQEKDGFSFVLNSSGKIPLALIGLPFRSLENNSGVITISGNGNWGQFAGNIELLINTHATPDTTFLFQGGYAFRDNQITFALNEPEYFFKGDGKIFLVEKTPRYNFNLKNLHNVLYALPEMRTIHKILNYSATNFQIDGKAGTWKCTGDFHWAGNQVEMPRYGEVDFTMKSQDDDKTYNATIDFYNGDKRFFGEIDIIQAVDYIKINKLNIENIMYSSGKIETQGEKNIEAKIIFPEGSLADFTSFVLRNARSIDQGKLHGFIDISGTVRNPRLSGELNLIDVMLNKAGLYQVAMGFQFNDNQLSLNPFTIARNQQVLYSCDGIYHLNSDNLDFQITGNETDLNSTITAFLNKPELLEGKGSANLRVLGKLSNPRFSGNVELNNGKLGIFRFDRIFLDIGEDQAGDSSHPFLSTGNLEPNGINLKQAVITRSGQFQIQAMGLIPFATDQSLNISIKGKGNILSILPELTPFFKETNSDGQWLFSLSGRPNNLAISAGQIVLRDGYLRLGDVAPEIKNIALDMELEQDGFLNVKVISGKVKGKQFAFKNARSISTTEQTLAPFELQELGLNLGVFSFETSEKGISLHIPGLMEKGEFGQFVFSGKNSEEQFYFAGPLEKPVVRGNIELDNVNFTFPFITRNSPDTSQSPVVTVLKMLEWDIAARAGKDLHYQRQIASGVDNVYVDLIADGGVGGLQFSGVLENNTFGVVGSLESSRGNVEYLDLDFQVIKAGVEFDMNSSRNSGVEFDKTTLLPIIYGEARTTVTDSTGFPYYINLTLLTLDKTSGQTVKRGRLGEMVFQLSTDNPNLGDTESELLASLGYSTANLPKMASEIIGISTDNLVFRPLFRPFERQLERTFRLDMVRFSSRFTRNLIEMNLKDERNFLIDSKLFLLRSTKLMVGKYIADKFFFLYTGQLEAGIDYRYQHEGFGFRHTLGLEYRVSPSLLLQMEYDYNSLLLMQKEDKKFMIRHSFPF